MNAVHGIVFLPSDASFPTVYRSSRRKTKTVVSQVHQPSRVKSGVERLASALEIRKQINSAAISIVLSRKVARQRAVDGAENPDL